MKGGNSVKMSRDRNIRQEFTTADRPELNGVAERRIATVKSAGLGAHLQAIVETQVHQRVLRYSLNGRFGPAMRSTVRQPVTTLTTSHHSRCDIERYRGVYFLSSGRDTLRGIICTNCIPRQYCSLPKVWHPTAPAILFEC